MGVALNQLPLPPPSPRLERAVRTLERLQRSAIASEVDLTRVGTLVATLLAQEAVQRQLTDFTLQLVQRGVQRGIRALFALPETAEPPSTSASQPAKPSFYERRRQAKQQQKEEEAKKKKFEPPQSSSSSSQPKSAVDDVESVIDPSLRDVVS